jgi:hypothetical protein
VTAPLAYGTVGVALFVGLAQAHTRLVMRRSPPVPHVLAIWLLGAAVVGAGVLASNVAHPTVFCVTNLSVYLFGGEIYLFVYAASVGSLSVRIMVETLKREPAPDALQRAIADHPPSAFFDIRLQGLLTNRLLTQGVGGRYQATTKGRRWARFGAFSKGILGVGIGG